MAKSNYTLTDKQQQKLERVLNDANSYRREHRAKYQTSTPRDATPADAMDLILDFYCNFTLASREVEKASEPSR